MTETTSRSRSWPISPTLLICAVASLVAVVGLFAPSLSPVQSTAPPASAGTDGTDNGTDDGTIEIVGFAFTGDLDVSPGQSIRVLNADGVPHTVTANDGRFDTGVIDGGGAGTFLAPDADGVVSFICTIHPSMTGELTIRS